MVSTPELPLRRDSNYLRVGRLPEDVTAEEVAADAEEAHAGADLEHRVVFLTDEPTGRRLASGFGSLGWDVEWSVLMAHRRPPERPVRTSLAVELDEEALRPAREADIRRYPWGTSEVAHQLLEARRLLRVETRFFAVVVDGEPVSFADLYLEGAVAQVEAVATVEPHRNRGYASAVVMRAVDEAARAGSDLVFLVALADDWPRELYRRLGFDEIGRFAKFLRSK
jgi:GNAT superfamily N-acetyltransferase